MYSKIESPSIVIYDGKTNENIGIATFKLSNQSERALLDLVNYGAQPSYLTLLDLDLYQPASDYIPPKPYESYAREGTINASFIDSYSGRPIPAEIRMKYNALARGNLLGNLYHFDSAEFNSIEIKSVTILY